MFCNVWGHLTGSIGVLGEIVPKTVPSFKLAGVQSRVAWITTLAKLRRFRMKTMCYKPFALTLESLAQG